MADYKHTLNLPQTDFPMRGNLAQREPEQLRWWQEHEIYRKQREAFADCPTFMLHDGPPYANGQIHVGHALNKTLKDIIIKSRHLLGYNSPYVPGWDCHGLPIEQKVEQKIGKPNQKVSATEFRAACRRYAAEQVALQKDGFMRLGILGFWDQPYLTMNFETEAQIVRALRDIVAAGHVTQGFKPINWCFDCASSLAEAEVEYQDKTSYSIDVAFAVKDVASLAKIMHADVVPAAVDVVIWTTTPWTLPANVAVSIHPEFYYVLVEIEGWYCVVAEELIPALKSRWKKSADWRICGRALGKDLDRLTLRHPFIDRDVLLINGTHVTLDAGTGCVHTAPAHGVEDYDVCQQYGIDLIHCVLGNGLYNDDTPHFAGQHIFAAEPQIIELLQTQNRLIAVEKITHSYPHCWRHKTPTIYRATTQWFISMDKAGLRQKALDGLNEVAFTPDWGKPRLLNMIAHRPDWCISRQRYWGVPLCFVVDKQTGQLHPDIVNIMDKAASAIEQKGVEAWYELSLDTLLSGKEVDRYEKLNDVLDVWFDSGTTHYSVLKKRAELSYPADLYLEGSDQHRGWFHSSLLTASAITGKPPYKALLTHGFTVDEDGRKMSKSLGNVVDPNQVIKTLGADILRLWVASADYTAEVSLSPNILNQRADAYRRMRNTCRFLLANLHDFDPEKNSVAYEKLLPLDRYVIAVAHDLQEKIKKLYVSYDFHLIYQEIFNFCSVMLGGFYLDVIKDRQYTVAQNALARRSAQTAIFHIIEAMVRWLAPILSFTAEEIWRYLPGKREESVFLTKFYEGLQPLNDDFLSMHDWELLLQLREKVNAALEKARNQGIIGGSLEAMVVLHLPPQEYEIAARLEEELRFILIVSAVNVQPSAALSIEVQHAIGEKCERCWHYLPDVGTDHQHPTLCKRCIENVDGGGELRRFA